VATPIPQLANSGAATGGPAAQVGGQDDVDDDAQLLKPAINHRERDASPPLNHFSRFIVKPTRVRVNYKHLGSGTWTPVRVFLLRTKPDPRNLGTMCVDQC